MNKDHTSIVKLPDSPGVYFFLGKNKKILYIGKATSLRDRVKSYFNDDLIESRGKRLVDMVESATTVEFRETDSVLEALILEVQLIKTHRPQFNILSKDDKTFNYVVITGEKMPRVLKVREKDLAHFEEKNIKYLFGPFPHGGQLSEAMKIVRKIFPFFDTKRSIDQMSEKDKKRLLLNQQIGLYPKELKPTEYKKTIQHIKLFFEGKKKQLIKSLEKEMKIYAKNQEFEQASEVKRKLFALNHIQDVTLIKEERRKPKNYYRIEAYDVAHTSGKDTVGVMVVIEDGDLERGGYRKFKLSRDQNDDIGSLKEILSRRLDHDEWTLPKLIVVDGGKTHKVAAEKIVKEYGYGIQVVAVVKDEKHKARDILGSKKVIQEFDVEIIKANAEAHRFAINYHRKKRDVLSTRVR